MGRQAGKVAAAAPVEKEKQEMCLSVVAGKIGEAGGLFCVNRRHRRLRAGLNSDNPGRQGH